MGAGIAPHVAAELPASQADLSVVTNDKQRRGQELARRREAHRLSVMGLSAVSGVSRNTIAAAEAGGASVESLERLEACLDELDEKAGIDTSTPPANSAEMIEFDITGPSTAWHVVVRAPAERADEARHQAVELLREWESGRDTP